MHKVRVRTEAGSGSMDSNECLLFFFQPLVYFQQVSLATCMASFEVIFPELNNIALMT